MDDVFENFEKKKEQPKLPDEQMGIYKKYTIERTDGQSGVGEKHENCSYFILDLNCDPNTAPAILAYAKACKNSHPKLSRDLMHLWIDLCSRFNYDGDVSYEKTQ